MLESSLMSADVNRLAQARFYSGLVNFEEADNAWWQHLYQFVTDGFLNQTARGYANPPTLKNGVAISALAIPKIHINGKAYPTRLELALKGDHRYLELTDVWIGNNKSKDIQKSYQIVYPDDPESEITQWFFEMEQETPHGGIHHIRIS